MRTRSLRVCGFKKDTSIAYADSNKLEYAPNTAPTLHDGDVMGMT